MNIPACDGVMKNDLMLPHAILEVSSVTLYSDVI